MRLKLVHSMVAIAILFCGHNSLGSAAQATAKGEFSDEKVNKATNARIPPIGEGMWTTRYVLENKMTKAVLSASRGGVVDSHERNNLR
jgi:hypothetical protein